MVGCARRAARRRLVGDFRRTRSSEGGARRKRTLAALPTLPKQARLTVRENLDEVLSQFNAATALMDTVCGAFEAAHDHQDWSRAGSHTVSLRHAVRVLHGIYTRFDLAILRVKS
jgi:hypothetical protein